MFVSVLQILIFKYRLVYFFTDKIVFSCHCKRHDPFKDKDEINEKNEFELVQFFGYFRPSSEIFQGDNSGLLSPYISEDDDQK